MPIWSRIRSLLGLAKDDERADGDQDDADSATGSGRAGSRPAPSSAAEPTGARPAPASSSAAPVAAPPAGPPSAPGPALSPAPAPAPAAASRSGLGGSVRAAEPEPADDPPLLGVIDDWNARTATGIITLSDGAVVGVGQEACQEFVPLIGLRVAVLATGVPPEGSSGSDDAGLWATQVRLLPGTETEYAARLRIYQVERAVRGAEGVVFGEPPWARNKVGKKPANPPRPQDAFFVLTVVLGEGHSLPAQPAALAALLHSEYLRRPTARVIPLARKGKPEPGFSAEIASADGKRRAFMLYRPQPYAGVGGAHANADGAGVGHVGLFVGGPHTPRVLGQLAGSAGTPGGPSGLSGLLGPDGEVRMLSDLARSLLLRETGAAGLVLNRAGKAWKPREIALSQLGDEDSGRVPFVAWIDWNIGERHGRRAQLSSGMEALGLPDVAVAAPDERAEDRARDVLLYASRALVQNALRPDATEILVPRRVRLQPGSHLLCEPADVDDDALDPDSYERYRVRDRSPEWLELELDAPALPA